MKKKKTAKKKAAKKKPAKKKAAALVTKYKAHCDDENLDLTEWTASRQTAYDARDAHKLAYPNHACDVLKK